MKEWDILGGQNILWPLLHFQGVKIPNPGIYAPDAVKLRILDARAPEDWSWLPGRSCITWLKTMTTSSFTIWHCPKHSAGLKIDRSVDRWLRVVLWRKVRTSDDDRELRALISTASCTIWRKFLSNFQCCGNKPKTNSLFSNRRVRMHLTAYSALTSSVDWQIIQPACNRTVFWNTFELVIWPELRTVPSAGRHCRRQVLQYILLRCGKIQDGLIFHSTGVTCLSWKTGR